jgi:hypothetical protein
MTKQPVDSKRLNKEQKEAVEYKTGPLLIIAGAGIDIIARIWGKDLYWIR